MPGEGHRRGGGQHRVDAEPAARQPGDRRVPAQLPERQHAQGDQRHVKAGPRRAGQRRLPAPA